MTYQQPTSGLLAELQTLVQRSHTAGYVDRGDREQALALLQTIVARIVGVVSRMQDVWEYLDEHLDAGDEAADQGDVLWQLRSLLTPAQDTAGLRKYEEATRGATRAPDYPAWYARHIAPWPPEPTPKERFETAIERLSAHGNEAIVAGLRMAWRGTTNATQEAQAAALAEAAVKGALNASPTTD